MAIIEINTAQNPAFVDTGTGGSSAATWTVTAVKTANYNAAKNELVRYDPTGGGFNITLPAAATAGAGAQVASKNVGTSPIQVRFIPTGADTIDGLTEFDSQGGLDNHVFVSDGVSNWMVLV